jgi:hypothetical protein
MRSWLRLFLVACLSLALPFQGMASASMVLCGIAHEPAIAAPVHDDAAPMPCHPTEAHAASTTADDQGSLGDLGQHQCSTCAACCAGTALPMATPVIAAPAEPTTVFVAPGVTVPVFATDGPDRPPRR